MDDLEREARQIALKHAIDNPSGSLIHPRRTYEEGIREKAEIFRRYLMGEPAVDVALDKSAPLESGVEPIDPK